MLVYPKDFGHTTERDPGTPSCECIGGGAIEVDARWRNVSKIAGVEPEPTYELIRLEPGRAPFAGRNDTTTTRNDITELGTPITEVVFVKVGARIEHALTRILGTAAPASPLATVIRASPWPLQPTPRTADNGPARKLLEEGRSQAPAVPERHLRMPRPIGGRRGHQPGASGSSGRSGGTDGDRRAGGTRRGRGLRDDRLARQHRGCAGRQSAGPAASALPGLAA